MRTKILVGALVVVSATTGVADENKPYDPFKVPKRQLFDQVRTIALRSGYVPDGTEDAQRVQAMFESLITKKLKGGGFNVIPSTEYESIWRQMSQRLGGVFDPIFGKPDADKLDAVRTHANREVQRTMQADAVMHVGITLSDWIPWIKQGFQTSHYYAGDQIVTWRGEPLAGSLLNRPQKILGTYLNIVLFDVAGVELYNIRSRIEWTKVFVAASYEEVPAEQLYVHAARNQEAVNVALDPMVDFRRAFD